MPWGVAGMAVASIGSAALQSSSASSSAKAAKNAANKQAYAAGEANYNSAAQQAQYRADVNPYMTTGNRALSLYESILSGTPLNKTASYEAGFSPDGTDMNINALTSVSPEVRNAILSRQIKSPGASDWSDATIRREIAQGAKTSGNYLGLDQAQWQAALDSLSGSGQSGAGQPYDAALEGAYAGAADGKSFGIGAVDNYQNMQAALGSGDYSSFFNSPDYQFALTEGLKGVDRSAASKGNLLSGSQIKATNNYAQGMAAQQFGNYYGRVSSDYNTYLDRLSSLAAAGQNAATGVGTAGINTAGQQSAALQNAGTATASGIVGAANAKAQGTEGWANALGQIGGMAGGISGLMGGGASMFNTQGTYNTNYSSDIKLKENIIPVGTENGHAVYEFNYKAQPNERYIGVMAQDIIKTNPDAVMEGPDGWMVDYSKLGVTFRRIS